MKKVFAFLFAICTSSFATSFSVGFGPYHGMIGLQHSFLENQVSVNLHLVNYDSDYDLIAGVGAAYHFMGANGPFVFHTSDWIYADDFVQMSNGVNYWRLIFGAGYQHTLLKHLGAYFEMGFEFFAGNGGYYLQFDQKRGRLYNDELSFPSGAGIFVPF